MNIRDMADQGSACRIRHHAMVMAIGCSKTAPKFLTLAELRLDSGIGERNRNDRMHAGLSD